MTIDNFAGRWARKWPVAIGAVFLAWALASGGAASAQKSGAPAKAKVPDCFEQLTDGTGDKIECDFPTRMTDEEREEARKVSRGVLQDAHCMVRISIPRKLVDDALTAQEHVFQAPPQPVTCTLKTHFRGLDKSLEIKATFSPRVTFMEGKAIDATPGLDNVNGVPKVLSYPVQLWVNKGSTIRDGMLKIVNAFKNHYGQRRI